MYSLLAISPDQYGEPIIETAGFLETLGFGGMILLIGMVAVFAVLLIIYGALTLFKVFFHDIPSKKKVVVTPEQKPEDEDISALQDEAELIAVITAAVAAYESDNGKTKFKVVSFRRV